MVVGEMSNRGGYWMIRKYM